MLTFIQKYTQVCVYTIVLCKLKTQRSNSIFGFYPSYEPPLWKTKRAVSCQHSV